MGDGWHLDFKKTHFDKYSPPDFYTRVINYLYSLSLTIKVVLLKYICLNEMVIK